MEAAENGPNKFDQYVHRAGLASAGLSIVLLAIKFLDGCGGLFAMLLSIVQVLGLLALLWLPLLWWRAKGFTLDNTAAK